MREDNINAVKVLLVGVDTGEERDFEHSMEELKSLAEAANKRVTGIIVQRMATVNQAFYIGTGKVAEVREYAMQCEAEEVIFDNTLSPSQVRNLGRELDLPILDRTNLILDIFAIRAKTKEAKLQVETARLQYILPRLVGMRENLSRQGGTGGKGGKGGGTLSNKGAGETKLELDRRKIEHRISELQKELDIISKSRDTMRKKRSQSRIPKVALVGYTNAGKSTILNRMVEAYGENSDKTVLEQDMLFATLETSVRCIHSEDSKTLSGGMTAVGKVRENKPFFLVDTVGFIDKLPHGLVKAFRSTLEEVKYADLLVQVVDFSDEHYKQHMEVTAETLKELGAGNIPQVIVYNKADICNMEEVRSMEEEHSMEERNSMKKEHSMKEAHLIEEHSIETGHSMKAHSAEEKKSMGHLPKIRGRQIYMAAASGIGLRELRNLIAECVYADCVEKEMLLPYDKGNVISYFMENATVLEQEYREDGVRLKVSCHKSDADKYAEYVAV